VTRLDSSARDYAIALVAVRRLHGFSDALKRIDLRLARDAEDAGRDVCCEGATTTHEAARLVRARVALYLRLLRRVEAWERGVAWWAAARESDTAAQRGLRAVSDLECSHVSHDDWAIPPAAPRTDPPPFEDPLSTWTKRYEEWTRTPLGHAPWRPLWTSAPPHDPGVTARMRREVKR